MKHLIAALAKDGHSRREVAGILKLPYVTCCKQIARYGLQSLFREAEFKARSRASIVNNKSRRQKTLEEKSYAGNLSIHRRG